MNIKNTALMLLITLIIVASSGCTEEKKNHPPVADAGPDQTVQLVDGRAVVHFSAASSYDPDGDELLYIWDFDASDGDNDVDPTEKNPVYTYYQPGDYVVTLTVSDGKISSKDTMTVTVTRPVGKVRAVIKTDDNLNDVVHQDEKKTIHFDGSDSTTTDGIIRNYEWDYNYSSGAFDVDDSGKTVAHDFESGKYVVALRVTNDTGSSDISTITVKMNYNETDNNDLDRDETKDYPLPLNTEGAYSLRVYLQYNNSEYDGKNLDIYLCYPNGTEANNTSDEDKDREEILYTRYNGYGDRLEVLGEWKVTIKNSGYLNTDYYLYLDVVYHS